MKEHRRALYTCMMAEGTLWKHLAEIDRSCNDQLEIIETAMMKQEDVTEALKASDQMEWIRRRNSIRNRAEEVILTELVYA
ncbi:MAG: TnpV protein [Solobacterium sp.]|nr:TnpV protein [Solobacterium sp.]